MLRALVFRALVALGLLASVPSASACLFFSNYRPFATAMPVTHDWSTASVNPALPKPKMSVEWIRRAPRTPVDYYTRISACVTGMIRINVRLDDARALSRTGFRFSQPRGDLVVVDNEPQQGEIDGDVMHFDFYIFEGPDAAAQPRSAELAVRAVNRDGELGPAASILIHADPAPEPGPAPDGPADR